MISKLMRDTVNLLSYVYVVLGQAGNLVEAKDVATKALDLTTRIHGQSHRRTLALMDF